MTRLLHQWMFSCLISRAYSKMTTGFVRLKLGKEWFWDLETWTLSRIFGMCWIRLWSVFHHPSGSEGNDARLDRNKSCDIAKAAHFLTRQIPDLPSRYQNQINRGSQKMGSNRLSNFKIESLPYCKISFQQL